MTHVRHSVYLALDHPPLVSGVVGLEQLEFVQVYVEGCRTDTERKEKILHKKYTLSLRWLGPRRVHCNIFHCVCLSL